MEQTPEGLAAAAATREALKAKKRITEGEHVSAFSATSPITATCLM
jgi:hypothetical protein